MRFITSVLLLMLFAPLLSAQRSEKRCRDTPIDSTNPSVPIYRDCHTDRVAKPRGTPPRLTWEPGQGEVRDGACFSAEFVFVIDTAGVPEPESIRAGKSNNAAFAEAVLQRIPSLRFVPAQRDGQPVRQLLEHRESAATRLVRVASPTSRPPNTRAPNC